MSRGSSKVFTCAHGGFRLPHSWQVVRPTLVSCRYGTPITISCRATRAISRQARSTSGMCSRTSAQNTQSKDESGNCSLVTSPATVVTCGYSNRGFSKSSPVTNSKYSVNNLEKWPSRAPMSRTEDLPLGSSRKRSAVRAFSGSLSRYFWISVNRNHALHFGGC